MLLVRKEAIQDLTKLDQLGVVHFAQRVSNVLIYLFVLFRLQKLLFESKLFWLFGVWFE
jgi:hypothetical protein